MKLGELNEKIKVRFEFVKKKLSTHKVHKVTKGAAMNFMAKMKRMVGIETEDQAQQEGL